MSNFDSDPDGSSDGDEVHKHKINFNDFDIDKGGARDGYEASNDDMNLSDGNDDSVCPEPNSSPKHDKVATDESDHVESDTAVKASVKNFPLIVATEGYVDCKHALKCDHNSKSLECCVTVAKNHSAGKGTEVLCPKVAGHGPDCL